MTTPNQNILGVLGGGQLGKMFAQAANTLGFRVCVFAPEPSSVAAHAAEDQIMASYDDSLSLEKFAREVSAVTFEFENVPASVSDHIAAHTELRPGASVLATAQNRLREKTFFQGAGVPVAPFGAVTLASDLTTAEEITGFPAILKTAESGYDGKGQIEVTTTEELDTAWKKLGSCECILEKKISLTKEVSIVIARNARGETALLGPFENEHRDHILFISTFPCSLSDTEQKQVRDYATTIADRLELQGVLCVEFFVDSEGRLLANEMAPRPHNSGHMSIESHSQSQFDLQVRAVADLPLFSPEMRKPAAMINLLGDLWNDGKTPNFEHVLKASNAYLHLYGKDEARAGRKMGHITVLSDTSRSAREEVLGLFESLTQ